MPTRFLTPTSVLRSILFLFLLLALGTTSLFAQITFSDFSDVSTLALNGSAAQATNTSGQKVLRLTPDGTSHVSGTAWFNVQQQSVGAGFTTVFQFQIAHDPEHGDGPADGIAFVLQNSGAGLTARGGSGGAIGYGVPDPGDNGTAIPNSLAVEFDTYENGWDPNANHVAVQSCGTAPNSQDHDGPCKLGLVSDLGGINLADGNVHTVVIDYDPGTLRVFLDSFSGPILTVSTDLSSLLELNEGGTTWVGFTGSTGGLVENNDILSWNFTPATAETSITQNLTPSEEPTDTNYVFGSYNHKLEYSNAGSDEVTVTAIPISQSDFHLRLVGTPFAGGQCAIYDGTGGLCVLFEVVCNGGADCTDLDYTLFNNFNTELPITGAGMLKAPIGTNNWENIIQSFTQTRNDPGGTGKTKGFSDFILCQNCTDAPTIQITSPPNGGIVVVGQSVPISFSCTPDSKAPNVTLIPGTGCIGNINGTDVHNGDTFVFDTVGPASMTVSSADTVGNTSTQTSSFIVGQPPAITSANNATFQAGVAGSFTVTTTGTPVPSITELGGLPSGVTFVDHLNGTGTLSGIPAASGIFNISFTAHNGANPDAIQNFTLTVNQAPAITSANSATFQVGTPGSFTVTATGFPVPNISEAGALPSGVTFVDNNNGTGTLSGTPTASGVFNITFTAHNGVNPDATQNFTLTVTGPQLSVTPTSINFGNVYLYNLLAKNVTLTNTGNVNVSISKVSVILGQADKDDYVFVNFCGSSIKPGKSCVITVFFWADDLGIRTATLNIADNAQGSPQQVSLSANVIKKGH